MTTATGRALWVSAAAGAAWLAWRRIGTATREELRLRAACAGSTLLGNPVAYRVLVLKSGDGPGIELHTGPAIVSQCTVVGVGGYAVHADLPDPVDLAPACGQEPCDLEG